MYCCWSLLGNNLSETWTYVQTNLSEENAVFQQGILVIQWQSSLENVSIMLTMITQGQINSLFFDKHAVRVSFCLLGLKYLIFVCSLSHQQNKQFCFLKFHLYISTIWINLDYKIPSTTVNIKLEWSNRRVSSSNQAVFEVKYSVRTVKRM